MYARRLTLLAAIALLSLLSLAGCAAQRKCESAACADDAQITAKIEALLYGNKAIAAWEIKVQTINHTVYLYGTVDTNVQRAFIEESARTTEGVEKVVNSISIRGRF